MSTLAGIFRTTFLGISIACCIFIIHSDRLVIHSFDAHGVISQEGSLRYMIYRDFMKRIEVLFLPPYAPECSPDEYLNHGLRLRVHSGELPFTADDIVHKMRS